MSKKILSIDVGIKNLAFCLLEINENKTITIVKWDIIDLTKTQQENEIKIGCSCLKEKIKPKKKQKKQVSNEIVTLCNSVSKFTKNGIYYCLKHAKTQPFLFPSNNLKPSFINKQKIGELIKISSLIKFKDEQGENKLETLKKTEIVSQLNNFITSNSFELIEIVNASKLDLVTIGKNIQSNMNILLKDDLKDIDTIIIENQISPIANRMKTIQGMIAQYFIMKNENIKIDFVSSSNKLKEFNKGEKLTYSDRKKLGIKKCAELIDTNTNFFIWKDFFITHKKKDDLSDSLLQGLWYTNNI
jgi:hypothetical protein